MAVDIKKDMKEFYQPPVSPVFVNVPEMNFLMLSGAGHPDSELFQNTIQTLYAAAYGIKFALKKQSNATEYVVPPLEGLWWTQNEAVFDIEHKENWAWTLMIIQPDFITQDTFQVVVEGLSKKKNMPLLSQVKIEAFCEGLCVQLMHIGPYSAEPPNIIKMHQYAEAAGYKLHGKHHEIYLGDPRRTTSEKLKTVLRQPICR